MKYFYKPCSSFYSQEQPPKTTHFWNMRGQIEKHPILSILELQDAVLREPSAQSTEASAAIAKAARKSCESNRYPNNATELPKKLHICLIKGFLLRDHGASSSLKKGFFFVGVVGGIGGIPIKFLGCSFKY